MPTVIALDVSLSMCRPTGGPITDVPEEEVPTRRTIAIELIKQFLDHIATHSKLEFVTLVQVNESPIALIPNNLNPNKYCDLTVLPDYVLKPV